MSKEKVLSIEFNKKPDVRVRIIENYDTEPTKKSKIKYPFELFNTVTIKITTDYRIFEFDIYNGYIWNGADIPAALWSIVGSRTSNQFLIASMLHDYMLQFKKYMIKEVLDNQITTNEFRRMTSLIFRECLKLQGTNTIKANVMSWCVDMFQHYFNWKGWDIGH